MQRALTQGAGSASAAALWVLAEGRDASSGVFAAATLLETAERLERPGNLFILVGLSPTLLAHSALEAEARPELRFSKEEPPPAVLVQVAAQTHVDRLFALRIVDAALEGAFERKWEVLGDRILHGMEGFGFDEGGTPDWSLKRASDTRGMWLMQQRHDYERDAFFALGSSGATRGARDRARAEIIGRPPGVVPEDGERAPGEPTERAAIEAHIAKDAPSWQDAKPHLQAMRAAGFSGLMRRGFPFRHDGVEGLVFLAAAESPDTLVAAWSAFNAGDRLAAYVRSAQPSLFFCPHVASWLLKEHERSALTPLPLPPSAEVLEHGPDLTDYMVTVDDLKYMHAFAIERGALRPPLFEQSQPRIRALFRQMHEVLAEGDADVLTELEELLDAFQRASNTLNRMVGQYVTKA